MTGFFILNSKNKKDKDIWMRLWNQSKEKEVYMNPDYLELYIDEQNEEAICACFIEDDTSIIYPFIKRPIDLLDESGPYYYDISTAYGYGGPCYMGYKNESIEVKFWTCFEKWCKENNVVSEFIRFSLFNNQLISYPGNIELNNLNIVCDLTKSEENIWMGFKHKVRKNVKKAKSNGVTVEIDTNGSTIDSFLNIYYSTMDRNNANKTYYFSRKYFEGIIKNLNQNFAIFNAIKDNKIISTELLLLSNESMYSFLGGTDSEFYHLRPNDLLKYEMILWGKRNNKKHYVLGGGYTKEDGIYKYKLGFEPNGIMDYKIGKRILDSEIYDKLVKQNLANINKSKLELIDEKFFPLYRVK